AAGGGGRAVRAAGAGRARDPAAHPRAAGGRAAELGVELPQRGGGGVMSDTGTMLGDLQKLVVAIQADLRQRSEELAEARATLEAEFAGAHRQQRTSQGFASWLEAFLTQLAAAWVLACVFVRSLEDNDLIAERWLAATDNRGRDEARHRHQHYFREHPRDSDRDYLQ